MKKLLLILALAMLSSCNEGAEGDKVKQAMQEVAEPATVQPAHNYALKDGYEYGYEQGVSQTAADAGQVASSLLMFKFAGKKDKTYQIYSKQSDVITVLECTDPCEFIKITTYAAGLGAISKERMRATPGSIGYAVLVDAVSGQLEQFIGDDNGKKFTLWFDEKQPVKTYIK